MLNQCCFKLGLQERKLHKIRPLRRGRDFQARNRRKPWRCQPITVAGLTIAGSARPAAGVPPNFRNFRQPTPNQADAEGRRGAGRASFAWPRDDPADGPLARVSAAYQVFRRDSRRSGRPRQHQAYAAKTQPLLLSLMNYRDELLGNSLEMPSNISFSMDGIPFCALKWNVAVTRPK